MWLTIHCQYLEFGSAWISVHNKDCKVCSIFK